MLSGGAAALTLSMLPSLADAQLLYGSPAPFSWETLQHKAKTLAEAPYQRPTIRNRDTLFRIDYDAYRQIRYKREAAVWAKGAAYPVELFHLGRFFMEPVRVFAVESGEAREVLYDSALFDYGTTTFASELPGNTGFAGLRVPTSPGEPDWLSFLGASYFRSPGETGQYGLSARGLALDTGMPGPEEFPRFSQFWVERLANTETGTEAGAKSADGITIYALLESKSVAGAYRIKAMRDKGTITEVSAVIYARDDVRRLGLAPLTSMFWYGKLNRAQASDWRPEIHDSDGLAIWTHDGEHIWRPLGNPPMVKLSSFIGGSPKGFGLLQRERHFEAYEDDGVFYNRRPSVWVEPLGDWGEGAVQLLEIPTDDETRDNIVAFWNPKRPLRKGERVAVDYRIYWRDTMPFPDSNATVIASRRGIGGQPGGLERHKSTKYVIDFAGGKLGQLGNADGVTLRVNANRGHVDKVTAYRVVDSERWRGIFDFTPDGKDAVDLRAYLERNGEALSETWMFQHVVNAVKRS
ncbi:MAG: glucan biosynthesis protein [Alphaproteobacteria bacterium]